MNYKITLFLIALLAALSADTILLFSSVFAPFVTVSCERTLKDRVQTSNAKGKILVNIFFISRHINRETASADFPLSAGR